MDMIIRAADRAISEIRNNASVEGTHATSLYSRCSAILQEDYGVTKKDAFRRFWDKVFKLDLCVRQILCLTASPAMYKLPLPEIIIVPNLEKITLQYDFQGPEFRALFNANPGIVSGADASTGEESILDYEGFLDMFKGKKLGTKINVGCHPYCEVNLLAYLLKNSIHACPYIAVSKLACVGCWMYFSAYNDTVGKRTLRISKYHVKGSHDKTYPNWVKPKLVCNDYAALPQEIDSALLAEAVDKLQTIQKLQQRPNRDSEGTDASESNLTYLPKTEEQLNMEDYRGLLIQKGLI
ncbi:hypothetical protein ACEPAF_7319 [Sanghuangporus sanghuang]